MTKYKPNMITKLKIYLEQLRAAKYTGALAITFNQGGIVGIAEVAKKTINL